MLLFFILSDGECSLKSTAINTKFIQNISQFSLWPYGKTDMKDKKPRDPKREFNEELNFFILIA